MAHKTNIEEDVGGQRGPQVACGTEGSGRASLTGESREASGAGAGNYSRDFPGVVGDQ